MEFTIAQVAQLLGGEVKGPSDQKVNRLAKIEEGTEGAISFLSNLKYEPYLYTTSASAVIVDRTFVPKKEYKPTLILVDNAYSAFTKLLETYHNALSFSRTGVEEPSYVGENTEIGEGIYRGVFSSIGKNCRIGKNVKIYPQVYIGDYVTIGDNTILYSGVKIYDKCRVGSQCTIHANTVIGSDGFGFAPQPDGSYKTIPQLGNVVIEDEVSIGANTSIDCATMPEDSTIIRQGAKIDNLIQIAHNVEIGRHTVIAAQTGISGSTKIGDYCVIAGQVGIVGHLRIPNRTIVTAQSGVSKNYEKEGLILTGSPAYENRENLKSQAVARRLPELEKRVRELEKLLKELSLPANS
ncbi:MAG: UDP-3-O-(3-hydroxymyristoyl)glucosamine N-acyltransferase [Siphonobacter sp.]